MAKSKVAVDVVKVLGSFEGDRHEAGVNEIAKRLGFYPSKVHRIAASLVEGGLMEQNRRTRKYRLGPRLFQLGLHYVNGLELKKLARPLAEDLSRKLDADIDLGLAGGDHALLIDHISYDNSFHFAHGIIGLPLHASGLGKTLLAHLPPPGRAEVLGRIPLTRYTENTITDLKELARDLDATRHRGYALDLRELTPQNICLAVPIQSADGETVAGLSASDTFTRLTEERFEEVAGELMAAASFISRQLGRRR